MGVLVPLLLLAALVVVTLGKAVRIIPQARAGIVERFGKYRTTLPAGLNVVTPYIDRVRYMLDLREQVVSFPPQPVITEDNLVVSIDTVIYFQVTNPVDATYQIQNYIQAIEQLTMTTLRNIIGGMDLEQTLTSREEINRALRGVLDDATGKWGIRVNRVELKGIDPPPSIKDSMEKQMRADRDKRAAILTAEGARQSAILTAEGQKQAAILSAEGDRESQILRAQAERESQILRAQGEGRAIQTVFQAIHDGAPDQSLLAYQYLQMLPKIADGEANKVWIVPSEIGKALEGLGSTIGAIQGIPDHTDGPRERVSLEPEAAHDAALDEGERPSPVGATREEVQAAIEEARQAAMGRSGGNNRPKPTLGLDQSSSASDSAESPESPESPADPESPAP
ncbi:MAG: SPFH/Band 7/PHB domain protein [Propionibacteriales bacterium]|nr:SPFH/Band 7/PHB domain protein [Propionibacteriales bacterium]